MKVKGRMNATTKIAVDIFKNDLYFNKVATDFNFNPDHLRAAANSSMDGQGDFGGVLFSWEELDQIDYNQVSQALKGEQV